MGKPGIRKFLQVLLSNAYDLILDEMPHGPLAGLLAADAIRGTAAGPRSPGTVFNLIYRMGHGGVVYAPIAKPLSIPGLHNDLAQARLVFAPTADYVETAFNPAKYGEMSQAPVIEAVQTTVDGTHWLSAIVQYAPSDLKGGWTEVARARLQQITLDTLAQVIPELSENTKDVQIITPDQIEAATGAPGGHWHHAEMSIDQVLTLRPAAGLAGYQIGPQGLFICGASSHPGGDVMRLAGRNAALAVLEQTR